MSIPAGNGAIGASGTGPALGYLLNLLWFISLFMLISENNMNTSIFFVHTLSLFYAMKLLLIFRIKIYRKLPRYLTVPATVHSLLALCWEDACHPLRRFQGQKVKRYLRLQRFADGIEWWTIRPWNPAIRIYLFPFSCLLQDLRSPPVRRNATGTSEGFWPAQ